MEEITPIWYVLAGDRIRLDGEESEVLDKNLTPPGNGIGFCLCTKAENSTERSRQLFRWNDEVPCIYY